MTARPMLLLALLKCILAGGCAEPCRPQIVEVVPSSRLVRVMNDCAGPVDLEPVLVCYGAENYTAGCVPLDPGMAVGASECVDVTLAAPPAPVPAYGIGLFSKGDDLNTDAPIDAVIWGEPNKGLRGSDGALGVPVVDAVPAGMLLMRTWGDWSVEPVATPSPCEPLGVELPV